MHGLIHKSIQSFLQGQYGQSCWDQIARRSALPADGFEAMLVYDDTCAESLLSAATEVLNRTRAGLLEDLGAYLVAQEPVRRLLRFGGADYREFLLSLDELQGRGQMALPELKLPALTVLIEQHGTFRLLVRAPLPGWGAVMTGLVRAMADDYGALAFIELLDLVGEEEQVLITLLEDAYAEGRRFDLALPDPEVR